MVNATFDLAVIGLGYSGLPTVATFANHDEYVPGVDVKLFTVDPVNRGEVPFVEPDLGVVVSGAVRLGNCNASTTVPDSDALKYPDPDRLIDKLVIDTRGAWRQPEGLEAELAIISAAVLAE